MTDLLKIKEAIYEVGLLFNQAPTDERITAYAKALQNYTPKQITFAFNQVILSGSAFFPSLAEVLKHLKIEPEKKEDLAPLIVNEIIQAIQWCGPHDEDKMFLSLSPNAKLVIQKLGNTSDIRNSDRENLGTVKAQLRDFVKGVLAESVNDAKATKLESIGINTGRVLEMRTMDFSGYLPEGA